MWLTLYLVLLAVVEEVGPVWVCLHEVKFKQLLQTQAHDVLSNLLEEQVMWLSHDWIDSVTLYGLTSSLICCGKCVQWSRGRP